MANGALDNPDSDRALLCCSRIWARSDWVLKYTPICRLCFSVSFFLCFFHVLELSSVYLLNGGDGIRRYIRQTLQVSESLSSHHGLSLRLPSLVSAPYLVALAYPLMSVRIGAPTNFNGTDGDYGGDSGEHALPEPMQETRSTERRNP